MCGCVGDTATTNTSEQAPALSISRGVHVLLEHGTNEEDKVIGVLRGRWVIGVLWGHRCSVRMRS